MIEEWRLIQESNGTFEVSNLGNIRRTDGRKVKIHKNNYNGYYYARLINKDNLSRTRSVHRIVALAFCTNENPNLYDQVNHIDGDKSNNKASNLEWVNEKLNMEHASKHGLINRTSEKRKAQSIINAKKAREVVIKPCAKYDSDGNLVEVYECQRNIANLRRLSYKGYYFRDCGILKEKYGEIPKTINVERIKRIQNKTRKIYTSTNLTTNEKLTYRAIKDLPIDREVMWYCFNHEIPDKENRMWEIENDSDPNKYSQEQINEAVELLKTHSYKEVQQLTGIDSTTLLRRTTFRKGR